MHRQTVGFDLLLGIVERPARVEDIVEHGRARHQPGDEPVAAARIARILGVIALDADEAGLAVAADLEAHPAAPDILIVVFQTGGEVVAEPTARQPRDRSADANQITDRRRGGNYAFGLVVGAVSRAHFDRGIERQAPRDVFDRAADRVATIERALRTAQDFDALDIIDIQHGGLRAVEIDIVEIDADALFEARNGVLLADPADEGRQRRIGRTAGFESDVGHALADIGNVERAAPRKLFAADCGNGHRHVDQPLLAPARGDDDDIVVGSGCGLGDFITGGLGLCGGCGKRGSRCTTKQAGG